VAVRNVDEIEELVPYLFHIFRNSKTEGVLLPSTLFSIFIVLVGNKLACHLIIWGLRCYLPPYALV